MDCAFLDLDHTIIRTGYREYLIGRPARLIAEELGISEEGAVELLRRELREVMRENTLRGLPTRL